MSFFGRHAGGSGFGREGAGLSSASIGACNSFQSRIFPGFLPAGGIVVIGGKKGPRGPGAFWGPGRLVGAKPFAGSVTSSQDQLGFGQRRKRTMDR